MYSSITILFIAAAFAFDNPSGFLGENCCFSSNSSQQAFTGLFHFIVDVLDFGFQKRLTLPPRTLYAVQPTPLVAKSCNVST
jgi:hypothetical protein